MKEVYINDYMNGNRQLPKMYRAIPVRVYLCDGLRYGEYTEWLLMVRRVRDSNGWRWQVIKDQSQKDIWQYLDDLEWLREQFEYHYSTHFN
ncbi:TPA: hypothetical protein ACHYRB_002035 [Proteus mirabilis]|nr:hypothetical protein [Proteus mirabilis]DAH60189.1 MAG TPA: hypothetical protein [Caudoviricetes sp.]HBC8710045.1 hypothetical protein [Proteus mirabilis]HEK1835666.1 hypothetical protein [Proteus mirabilis]